MKSKLSFLRDALQAGEPHLDTFGQWWSCPIEDLVKTKLANLMLEIWTCEFELEIVKRTIAFICILLNTKSNNITYHLDQWVIIIILDGLPAWSSDTFSEDEIENTIQQLG